jgi:hypothetical protein
MAKRRTYWLIRTEETTTYAYSPATRTKVVEGLGNEPHTIVKRVETVEQDGLGLEPRVNAYPPTLGEP